MMLAVDERDELRSTARGVLTRDASSAHVRATIADELGFDRGLWSQMVELGWVGIHVDEKYGGAGCGYVDLSVVLYELGRLIVPSPFLASAVLAGGVLSRCDNETLAQSLLPSLVAGESLAAVAMANVGGSYDLARLTTTWESSTASLRVQGSAALVLDADIADVVVVAARAADGTTALVAVDTATPGLRIERTPAVDATRRPCTVSFDDVVVSDERMLCEPGERADELFDELLAIGVIATACDATGAAEATLERAAEYATHREQFGKPIGSFQAVKHHCANMAMAVEASRAATRAAVEVLDGPSDQWQTTAAVTSSYVGPACSMVGELGLRVHGGIGFTWEDDSHLYLKRMKLDEVLFGTPSWHRRRLASVAFPAMVTS